MTGLRGYGLPGAAARRALVLTVSIAAVLLVPSVSGGPAGAAVSFSAGRLAAPISPSSLTSPGNQWLTFQNGAGRSGVQGTAEGLSAGTAPNLTLEWSYASGGRIVTQPAIADGAVYFGSWDGREYSVNASNGAFRWSTSLGASPCYPNSSAQGVSSSAAVQGGVVYVGGGANDWYALSTATGAPLWKVFTGNSSPASPQGGHYDWASPLLSGNSAYVGISSHCDHPLVQGGVREVDLSTHTVIRQFNTTTLAQLGASVWASPALAPNLGRLFVATGNLKSGFGSNTTLDDSILALDPSTLKLLDRYKVPYALRIPDGDFGATPALFTDYRGVPVLVEANKDGSLYALDQRHLSAGTLWRDVISTRPSFSSAAVVDGIVYVGSGNTVGPHGIALQGSVRAINGTTGKVLWTVGMPGNVFGPVVAVNGLVVAAGGTELAVLRSADGRVLFRYNATHIFEGGASIAGGEVFVGNAGGSLLAFGVPLAASISSAVKSGNPLHLTFQGDASGGAQAYVYTWHFGDGTSAKGETVAHNYGSRGSYGVVLQVSDQAWNTVSVKVTVVVRGSRAPRGHSGSGP